jgi:hypothetical protein
LSISFLKRALTARDAIPHLPEGKGRGFEAEIAR